MQNPKIFVVEDQDLILTSLKKELRQSGFVVSGDAKSSEEALLKIKLNQPDLILMDINIQGAKDGIQTAIEINLSWNIPIIYLTASNDEKTIERAKKTEPYGFVPKTVNHIDLKRNIEFALYSHSKEVERLKIRAELDDSRHIFKNLLDLSRDAIFLLNKDKIITHWNNSAIKIFGYSEEKAVGEKFLDLFVPIQYHEDFNIAFEEAANNGKSELFGKVLEMYARKANGDLFPSEMQLQITILKSEWNVCAYIRDVTERIESEQELTKLIEELQVTKDITEQNANELIELNAKLEISEQNLKAINASKDRFFSIIAHDLKGPFQGLLGYSELLASGVDSYTKEEVEEFAHSLNDSAVHLFKLLENLLHWARIQNGAIEYNPDIINLKDLADENIHLAEPRAKQKNIHLENLLNEDIYVLADANMISTVIRNLIANSIKFTNSENTIGVKARTIDSNEVEFCVYDTGLGMNEEVRSKLFQIGSKVTTLGTANEQGTGLGLILCKDLIEKNKGNIWVESELGKGSHFYFTLPNSQS